MNFRTRNKQVRKNTFTDIPMHFPAIYREDGSLFVDFIKTYYQYVDELENDFREAYNIRDIDTTYERFLIYFKEKYLKEVPLDTQVDTRFIVKHIQDLYRRKGSEESLRLLFRLFFNEEIEVFYPSTNILKISDSKYGSAEYIEMQPVSTFRNYPIRKGDRLFGDTSKARAFVDEIVFRNFNGVLVPILYLSNTFGKFIRDDGLTVTGQRLNEQGEVYEAKIFPGKIIRGNIDTAEILTGIRTSGNRVGDILEIRSLESGVGGLAAVTSITTTTTGVIKFKVEDGGYGYSANATLNNIYISNQAVVVDQATTFSEFDVITAANAQVVSANGLNDGAYANNTVSGTAEVIKYDAEQKVLFLRAANNDVAFDTLPVGGKVTLTNSTTNTTFTATGIAAYNGQASFTIGSLKDTETVTIITDIIGDFLNVPLNSSDYGMTGSGAETLNTTLRDAFTPIEITIGEINTLKVIDEGIDYRNDVASIVQQPEIANFEKRDIGLVFDRIDFVLQAGDIITQTIEIEDLTYQANTVPYTVRGEYLRREGNVFYFRQKSFYGFDNDYQVNIRNNLYDIESLTIDDNSDAMGDNAIINGEASFELGQIETVSIVDTGFRYCDGETVELLNAAGEVAARAVLTVRGQGFTEGRWTTTTSFLNERTKVIHDNDYYQEYSYEISTILNPSIYESMTRDLVQVAGTKQFNSPLINSDNDLRSTADVAFEVYNFSYPELVDETGSNTFVTASENVFITIQGIQYEIPGTGWTLVFSGVNPITFQNTGDVPFYVNFSDTAQPPTEDIGLVYLPGQGEIDRYISDLTYKENAQYVFVKHVFVKQIEYRLVAVVATLDEETSNSVNTQIGS